MHKQQLIFVAIFSLLVLPGCGKKIDSLSEVRIAVVKSDVERTQPVDWRTIQNKTAGYTAIVPKDVDDGNPLYATDEKNKIVYQINCPPPKVDTRNAEARTNELVDQMTGIGATLLLNEPVDCEGRVTCQAFAFTVDGLLQIGRLYVDGDREFGLNVTVVDPENFPAEQISFFFEAFDISER